jgi:hypothetical protein
MQLAASVAWFGILGTTGCEGIGSAVQMNRREYSFVSMLKIYKDKEALFIYA